MTRKKKGKSKKGISNLTNTILSILKKDRNQSYNYKQIAAKIGVNDASSRNQIIKKLRDLQGKKEIEVTQEMLDPYEKSEERVPYRFVQFPGETNALGRDGCERPPGKPLCQSLGSLFSSGPRPESHD